MAKTNKGRKLFATTATAALVASAIVPVASAAQINDFNTISSYAQEAVQDLVDRGVIQGDEKGNFNPRKSVTRAEAATILVNALELESTGSINFTDVKAGAWYYDAINAAVNNGIFQGQGAGKFNPSGNLTRSEAAIILVDAFGLEGSASLSQFSDSASVKAWAQEALEIAVANGVIKGDNGKLNPNAPITRQDFAVMYSRTEGVEAPVSGAIKAINNTTVEITFEEPVTDLAEYDFKIDGLTISNKVVKQTDSSTVVLTTSAQEADKTYKVTLDGEEIGSFKGISAVIPTAIKVTTPSVQGTIGKDVTVSAQVTVPEGQSKAGIPVTFNIVNENANLNNKIEVVAYTNAEGVASYSYTRYYKNNDNVTAYATDKASVFGSGKVYWAQGLTVTEVTEGNTLANGSKKVYKIKTDSSVTETFGTTSTSDDYNYVNVAFLENVNVAPDKLVRDVEVIDTGLSTNAKYPSQVTTGGVQVVRVKVNANGEGSFTLTGSNGSVTPVVFVDESTNRVGKHTATALQAAAPAVKFELNHTLGLTVKAEGVQNAAAINTANANNKGTGEGGRDYTVTITDKNGKVAPAGTVAYVTFESGNYSTDKKAYILDANGNRVLITKNTPAQAIKVTGAKGEATFTLVGEHDAYAAPTVYLENGKETGLDKADLQSVGESTYFVDAVINNAALKVLNADKKEVTTLPSSQTAYFEYSSVDQNGFDYYAGTGSYEVSYQVTAQFADVTAGGKLVKAGTTETVKINAVNGKATLVVTSTNVASNVTVQASASLVSLPNQTATIEFTKGSQIPAVYTGQVSSIDAIKNTLTFTGYDAIAYSTASFKNVAGVTIDESTFEATIKSAIDAGNVVKVSAVKNADGTYTLAIESITGSASVPVTVTSAQTLDVNGDGIADTIELVFSKNVDATTLATTDFALTTGTVASITDGTVNDNKISLGVTGATGLSLGTLTVSAKASVAVDTAALAASSIVLPAAIAGTGVTGAVAVTTAGGAGTKQVDTLSATAATATGNAIVTVAAAGFNGNAPLNITVPVIGSDADTVVGSKVYAALLANATVTGFFDVTQGATTEEVILTAKTAAANDATTLVTLANNVGTATSTNATPGVAPVKEVATVTIATGATNAGTIAVSLVDGTFTKTVNVAVTAGDTPATVAGKVFAALIADTTVTGHYDVTISGAVVTLTEKVGGVGTVTTGSIN